MIPCSKSLSTSCCNKTCVAGDVRSQIRMRSTARVEQLEVPEVAATETKVPLVGGLKGKTPGLMGINLQGRLVLGRG
ncbi:hypothetical protein AOLI_G00298780 [Acnodon oligacanthus]